MKKILFLVVVILCFTVYRGKDSIEDFFNNDITIGIVDTVSYEDFSLIDEKIFSDYAKDKEVFISYTKVDEDAQTDTVKAFCDNEEIDVIVVNLAKTHFAKEMVAAAKQSNKGIIFYGESPATDILKTYSKSWYVGTQRPLSGELMGGCVFTAYSNGEFIDKNNDLLLQYVTMTDGSTQSRATETYSISTIEDCGLFTENVADIYIETSKQAYDKTLEFIDSEKAKDAELFICSNAEIAQGVISALNERNLLVNSDSEQTILTNYGVISMYHTNDTYGLISDNLLLGTVIYDAPLGAETILSIAKNVALQQTPTKNIQLPLNENQTIILPYLVADNNTIEKFNWIKPNED